MSNEFFAFGPLQLSRKVGQALKNMGFEEPTPIQIQAIPFLMEGKDVIGQAQTGTGKTAAFGIPLVQKINPRGSIQALVITPTRELAIQVAEEISRIGRFRNIRTLPIYGGQSIDRQIRFLRQGVQVVIGTPGRLLDHLNRGTLKLGHLQMVVLDEADEMLDMGFIEDIEAILKNAPKERQTLLFSATIPKEILDLAQKYLQEPEFLTVSQNNLTVPQIEQIYYEVREKDKLETMARLLDILDLNRAIVFCRTKRGVDELVSGLQARGYPIAGLHGDLSQYQRNQVMRRFKNGQIEIMAATDVAARGLDIESVSHVINYDIPQDVEFYIHRIGRTGRAGKSGMAITLVSPRDYRQLRLIENLTHTRIRREKLPSLNDLAERQKETLTERIQQIIEHGKLARYRDLIDPLVDDYDPVDIAAAILKMTLGNVEEEEPDYGNTGAKPGMVRLFMTIGRKDGIKPLEMVKMIASETGMPANLVGDINIFDKFTFVEVNQEWASCVINYLHHSSPKGRRISVEPARRRFQD